MDTARCFASRPSDIHGVSKSSSLAPMSISNKQRGIGEAGIDDGGDKCSTLDAIIQKAFVDPVAITIGIGAAVLQLM